MDEDNIILDKQKIKKEEKEEEKENDEKKEKNLVNNRKAVYIDSGAQRKEFESIIKNDYDYELNIYRKGNDIRQNYVQRLILSKMSMPNLKLKKFNSIIIFEWDDTLFPTSFLTPSRIFDENMNLNNNDKNILLKLEQAALKILTKSVEEGDVFIITNAINGWVENSAHRFYPNISQILDKIKIIYAKEEYEKFFQEMQNNGK